MVGITNEKSSKFSLFSLWVDACNQGLEVQGISIMQTLHLEPIFYFFGGQTLNLKPILVFLEVRTLNLEPIIFFLNGQTLNLGPFPAEFF
jgi:hypothetical protein